MIIMSGAILMAPATSSRPPQLPAETVALALALAPRHGLVIWLRSAWVKCHRQAGSGLSAVALDRRRRRGRGAMYTKEEGGEP